MLLRKERIPEVRLSFMQIAVAVTVMEGTNPRNPDWFVKLQKLQKTKINKPPKAKNSVNNLSERLFFFFLENLPTIKKLSYFSHTLTL